MAEYQPLAGREVVAQFAGPVTVWLEDTLPNLELIFVYDAGGYVDLSPGGVDATITIYIARYRGTKMVKSGAASIIDAAKGNARFAFPSAFVSPGLYEGQAKLDFGSSNIQRSQKFLIHVREGTPTA